jgi:YidC/Oxa1 family membrane protein insertase
MVFDNRDHHGYRTGMTVDMADIAPGTEVVKSFRIYLGEKDKGMLATVDQKLVDASDVSTLIEPIRYFVIWALMGINKLFGNLGWSLVVFSILTKIVFMPLTKKSTQG